MSVPEPVAERAICEARVTGGQILDSRSLRFGEAISICRRLLEIGDAFKAAGPDGRVQWRVEAVLGACRGEGRIYLGSSSPEVSRSSVGPS